MTSTCGSTKSHPALTTSSFYRPGSYPYQSEYYLPPRSAWYRVPPHVNKNGKNTTKWKIGSAVLIISAMLVLIAVLAVAGLALWMGALRNDPKNAVTGFACSFRVSSGERYYPMLKLNTSMAFREKERKYKNIFELLFRRSVLAPAYKQTFIDKFENGTLKVFFRVYLDRRKLPKSISNVEDTIADILAKETYSTSSLFKDMELDLASISVKTLDQDGGVPNRPQQQQQQQTARKKNTMITKNGLLRPSIRNTSSSSSSSLSSSSSSPSSTTLSPIKTDPDEANIDFSNIPTIQGTYKVTKLNGTDSPEIAERSRSTSTTVVPPETTERMVKTTRKEVETTSSSTETSKPETTSSKPKVTEVSTTKKPFKDFVDPEFETSPWRPIIPGFVNTELRLKLNDESVPSTVPEVPSIASKVDEPSLLPVFETIGETTSRDSEDHTDRIVPQEMVNFRVNGKFKNKIPTQPSDEPLFRDEVVSLPIDKEVRADSIEIADSEPIRKTYNVRVFSTGNVPIPETESSAIFGVQSEPEVAGIGEAEVVLDVDELEGRNRFSEIEASLEDAMQDRKAVLREAISRREPIYTSYKSPDLNGEAKPILVENPGTLRPFRHTIPVDKIAEAENEDEDQDREGPSRLEEKSKLEFEEQRPPISDLTTSITIDDDKTLKHTTTEIYSEILHPLNKNNGQKLQRPTEKLQQREDPIPQSVVNTGRNSTFVEIETVKYTPGSVKNESLVKKDGESDRDEAKRESELKSKVYNDTLKANVVENLVTLAPVKSNSGIGRPIRPRPRPPGASGNYTEDNYDSEGGELPIEDIVEVADRSYEKLRTANEEKPEEKDEEGAGSPDKSTKPDRQVVEVITSISTRVSEPEVRISDSKIGGSQRAKIEAPDFGANRSEEPLFDDFKNPGNSDRKISNARESIMLLEKLKQFAKVRTDTLTISTKQDGEDEVEDDPSRDHSTIPRPEVPSGNQGEELANFDKLTKLATVLSGDKVISSNDTDDFILSRDGIKVPTKVLIKAEERTEKMRSSTEENPVENNGETCQGFQCNDGKCLPAGARCNMLRECATSEDESNCRCGDFLKAQLLYHKICDGTPDCWDYSDETDCDWCGKGQFVCGNSKACVNPEKVCDGFRDCPSGEDEKKCAALIDENMSIGEGDTGVEIGSVESRDAKGEEEVEREATSTEGGNFSKWEKYEDETGVSDISGKNETDQEMMESSILETTTFRIVVKSGLDETSTRKSLDLNDEEALNSDGVVSGREITPNLKSGSIYGGNSFHTVEKNSNANRPISSVIGIPYRSEIDDYNDKGFLSVRKNGKWGKLCLTGMDNLLERKRTIWTVEDLGRAVCKAITYQDYERVEKVRLESEKTQQHEYYSLVYNEKTSEKTSLTFKPSNCPSGDVLRVKCKNLECGVRTQTPTQARWPFYRDSRIVGGGSSAAGSWPWQVALYKEGGYQCGGALVNDMWIISAAHCFYHTQSEYWVARIGTTRRGSFASPHEQLIHVNRIILHPDYIDIGFINDISLLKLERPVVFSDYVRPVCLPKTEPKGGEICKVTGWGQLFELGRVFPDTLQEVELPVMSTDECRRRTLFLPLYKITSGMLCAGLKDGGRDACLGDSGGPLVCPESNNKYTLQGITSNGYGCARPGRPGIYTKVHSYVPWIEGVMADDEFAPSSSFSLDCKGHRCPLGQCLPKSRVCNGYLECSDGSDELGCTID
ncbi:uncharacterized protein [Neodiprion pinetum]|uniref:uncharacterized protein isoform X1 n=1 Tax=Neodiprion pinetum TaxID=441929 RepID=UPI001EDCC7B9|nr:uncharacterized protein LOC124214909 isoform X1 [Neodiprion pinetum]XP_046473614.1 uncharacterized protein LOC124214909 isoform X1 [Neodiprion pinetum]